MPDPALPEPRGGHIPPGRVLFVREYRDPAGRPMRGTVDIISREPITRGKDVTPASSARIEFTDGVLRAYLLPGRYLVKAQLTNHDGGTFLHDDAITVRPEEQ